MSDLPTSQDFKDAFERDLERGHIKEPRVAEWGYIRRTRTPRNQQLLFEFPGPQVLPNWIVNRFDNFDTDGLPEPRPQGFWSRPTWAPQIDELIAYSEDTHKRLLAAVGVTAPPGFSANQDAYNAQDFYYCTALTTGVRTVVDFGAGAARQSILFTGKLTDRCYVAIDAIEQPYLLQRWVFEQLGLKTFEYLDHPDADVASVGAALRDYDVVHLPSWRVDLLPDASIDLVMFVWNLSEQSGEGARAAIEACTRVVRPGGYVYIRDEPNKVSYRRDAEQGLPRAGFEVVYQPRKVSIMEIHATPRLYRRTDAPRGAVRSTLRRARRAAGGIRALLRR